MILKTAFNYNLVCRLKIKELLLLCVKYGKYGKTRGGKLKCKRLSGFGFLLVDKGNSVLHPSKPSCYLITEIELIFSTNKSKILDIHYMLSHKQGAPKGAPCCFELFNSSLKKNQKFCSVYTFKKLL